MQQNPRLPHHDDDCRPGSVQIGTHLPRFSREGLCPLARPAPPLRLERRRRSHVRVAGVGPRPLRHHRHRGAVGELGAGTCDEADELVHVEACGGGEREQELPEGECEGTRGAGHRASGGGKRLTESDGCRQADARVGAGKTKAFFFGGGGGVGVWGVAGGGGRTAAFVGIRLAVHPLQDVRGGLDAQPVHGFAELDRVDGAVVVLVDLPEEAPHRRLVEVAARRRAAVRKSGVTVARGDASTASSLRWHPS